MKNVVSVFVMSRITCVFFIRELFWKNLLYIALILSLGYTQSPIEVSGGAVKLQDRLWY